MPLEYNELMNKDRDRFDDGRAKEEMPGCLQWRLLNLEECTSPTRWVSRLSCLLPSVAAPGQSNIMTWTNFKQSHTQMHSVLALTGPSTLNKTITSTSENSYFEENISNLEENNEALHKMWKTRQNKKIP
ncbi:hypothetical protein E2C01_018467 [Portunus trituberculatus]|uniref:Uncharacterized protein n=1 Tax=Portunus trituberculatus TaxID=210409 RepID=A0A5B7DV79_PORTR|nr:hypothetical protein [Portunus trituberculatus]